MKKLTKCLINDWMGDGWRVFGKDRKILSKIKKNIKLPKEEKLKRLFE